jgi:hypothetical protein
VATTVVNPNPARVPAGLWWFWLQFKAMEPTAVLSGIYAPKPGYHNIRKACGRKDYSVQTAKDRGGPDDKAAGMDITFPDAQRGDFRTIAKYSARLLRSGRDLDDERGNYLREFFGNADLDREVEGWDYQRVAPATSDTSHLWHIHLSWLRVYVNDLKAMRAVLSILSGESVKVWRAKEAARLKPKPKVPAPRPPAKAAPVPAKPVLAVPPKLAPRPIVVVRPKPIVPVPPEAIADAGRLPDALPPLPSLPSLPSLPAPPVRSGSPSAQWRAFFEAVRELLARPFHRP